jgi:chemotaxis regulatin CheY-phosphate phosphatase CheZ
MPSRQSELLLSDSESVLRLLDSALTDLGVSAAPAPDEAPAAAAGEPADAVLEALRGLPQSLQRIAHELSQVLVGLRHSRDVLERTAVERLQHTNEKLREVTSTTEVAATDIMDAVDRALGLVDELDAEGEKSAGDGTRAGELRAALRDELFGVMGSLQFQDITTQQINYASSVLHGTEQRLAQLAELFHAIATGGTVQEPLASGPPPPAAPAVFDPGATTADAGVRQALVDEIFLSTADRA